MTAFDNYMFNKCTKLKQQQQRAKVIREYYIRLSEKQTKKREDNSTNMFIGRTIKEDEK